LNDPAGKIYYGFSWKSVPTAIISDIYIPSLTNIKQTIFYEITIPSSSPPIGLPGQYYFAIGATEVGTRNIISNVPIISFEVE